ncbi:two-component system, OmpR family, sensor histidine kinase SenX3 [Ferrithrix thermotolerans DSM 19514]|jgi:two-component system sensor histidine kinase SenX3|uniref:Sensor-like histidine kinase SenX3 n=1 Tax=Ferrithrix thermotolerans DSM 19514 TaxID=1121881 RepID=A0A1M4TZ12_9ACTN|nr:ATP-binding protein [Ferrithrix thermotolerans]SHE49761.1 two-component system, OmpR family, sensor histidine kinase SenX3 [Ferrithrix thermotolerans DSM 19514]
MTQDKRFLELALNALDVAVVVCDIDGRAIFKNSQAERMFSTSYGNALAAREFQSLIDEAANGNYITQDFELYGPPKRSFLAKATPLIDNHQVVGFTATIEDVSLKKQLDDVRRDFVANVSHELKTPIGAMQLLAETMSIENDPEVLARLSARVEKEALRLGRIVEDLLDLSRIESSGSADLRSQGLEQVISEAVSRVATTASLKEVTVEVDMDKDAPDVAIDTRQMISALYNLLDNAIKYSDQGGHVTLSINCDDTWVLISVKDSGIGIPPRDIERIFERFYRVDQNRSRITGGTGLGLSIVRHVVENHKGRITVESEEGTGSTFTIWLPIKYEER